jgi:hypothetical protein
MTGDKTGSIKKKNGTKPLEDRVGLLTVSATGKAFRKRMQLRIRMAKPFVSHESCFSGRLVNARSKSFIPAQRKDGIRLLRNSVAIGGASV